MLFVGIWSVLFLPEARCQGLLETLQPEVIVPPGGVLEDGSSGSWPVQSGDILLSMVQSPTSMYACAMNESGELVTAEHTPFRGFYMKPWGEGEFVWFNYTIRKWTVVDASFVPLDTLTQSFVDFDDYHDVHLFDDGTYLVVMLQHLTMDLSEVGGLSNAVVLNPHLVHLDEQENVLKSWSGVDHFPVDPALDEVQYPTVDHLHWNSLALDGEGGLLLSFRNRSQIVRLRPEDWSVHWKLGGADGEFALDDPDWGGFARQHDVHDLGGGRILLFDNGTFSGDGNHSRALELELDTMAFQATNVWQFDHPEQIYSGAQGSAIRMENGNTLIGWGTAGTPQHGTRVTEVTADGHIAMEVRLPAYANLYRARKYPEGMLVGCTDTDAVNITTSSWLLGESLCLYGVDNDGDSFSDVDGDCNDADASIYPEAPDFPGDGVDQDCDGQDAVLGCTDSSASNYEPLANVDGGTCLYEVQFKVDLSQEINPSGEPWSLPMTRWEFSELDSVVTTTFDQWISPSNVAWQTAQFTFLIGAGAYQGRVVRPDGEAEVLVRPFEVVPGGGNLDLGIACFNAVALCPGCTDPMDVAFNPWAISNDGCEGWSVPGCMYPDAANFSVQANQDDGSCMFEEASTCPGDLDEDGSVTVNDLMSLLASIGAVCE